MATTIMTITPAFVDAIESMSGFFYEMNPDLDMCYDYVCEQADVPSFVDNNDAWDMFYEAWQKVAEENGVPEHVIAGDYRY